MTEFTKYQIFSPAYWSWWVFGTGYVNDNFCDTLCRWHQYQWSYLTNTHCLVNTPSVNVPGHMGQMANIQIFLFNYKLFLDSSPQPQTVCLVSPVLQCVLVGGAAAVSVSCWIFTEPPSIYFQIKQQNIAKWLLPPPPPNFRPSTNGGEVKLLSNQQVFNA